MLIVASGRSACYIHSNQRSKEVSGMQKAINISALIFFIWLILNAVDAPSSLLYFLLMGELPGLNIRLSPTMMLALMTLSIFVILFGFAIHHIGAVRRAHQHFNSLLIRRERFPRRRFERT